MEGTNDDPYGSKAFSDISASYLGHWVQTNTNSSVTANYPANDASSQQCGIERSWNPEFNAGAAMAMEPSCMPPKPGANLQKMPAQCRNTSHTPSCIRMATNILTSMRTDSPSCLMDTRDRSSLQPPDVAVDCVLSATHEASCAVRRLLDCPCHAKPQRQLLQAVICAEIITSYQRIINTYDRDRNRRSTVDLGRGNNTLPDQAQHPKNNSLLNRAPIFIGNYKIEDRIETILIGQVLRKRLQALEELMGEVFLFVGQTEEMKGVKNGIESFLGVQLSTFKYGLAILQRDEGGIGVGAPIKEAGT